MASYSAAVAKHATLTTTTVDSVTLTQSFEHVEVINRDAADYIYVTYGVSPADPTAAGDDSIVVPPGSVVTLDWGKSFVCKIIGDGGAYSVQGVDG